MYTAVDFKAFSCSDCLVCVAEQEFASREQLVAAFALLSHLAVFSSTKKKALCKKRFSVTSNL
jgi:hypothetical protein